jgi:alanyl-tRNA synthetase
MTRRLYYDDAYTTRFDAEVIAVEPGSEGRVHVVLDATYFYPTSGGQMHDIGTLAGARVVDVIDEDERIVHVVDGPALAVGARVHGEIDAERRRDHREQHTGQHVLSRVIEDALGLPTVSSRLGETANTLDLATDRLDESTLAALEDRTNRVLWDGRPVYVHLLDPVRDRARAESWGLRQKVDRDAAKERAGVLRVVEVEGVDHCACGGTHVRHTSEVGLVAITGTERVKGGLRIAFVCGARALRYRRERQHMLDRIARTLTTAHEQVEIVVDRLLEETKERQKRMIALARELVASRAPHWVSEAPHRGDAVRIVVRRLDADENLAFTESLRAIVRSERTLGVVLAAEGEKGQIAIGRSRDLEIDCRALLDAALAPVQGRGGGQPDLARGGFAAAQIETVELAARRALEG